MPISTSRCQTSGFLEIGRAAGSAGASPSGWGAEAGARVPPCLSAGVRSARTMRRHDRKRRRRCDWFKHKFCGRSAAAIAGTGMARQPKTWRPPTQTRMSQTTKASDDRACPHQKEAAALSRLAASTCYSCYSGSGHSQPSFSTQPLRPVSRTAPATSCGKTSKHDDRRGRPLPRRRRRRRRRRRPPRPTTTARRRPPRRRRPSPLQPRPRPPPPDDDQPDLTVGVLGAYIEGAQTYNYFSAARGTRVDTTTWETSSS